MFSRIETYIAQLQADPLGFLITMAYTWGVILFSLILHECAHGYAALKCGDPTAKMLGRLSLNPVRHLDPLGTVFMFVFGFGWAKPVPVNPRNFRDFRRDDFLVSVAGITVNLTIFIAAALLSCIVNRFLWTQQLTEIMLDEFGELDILLNPYYEWVLTFQGKEGAIGARSIMNDGYKLAESFRMFMEQPWLLWIQRGLLLLAQVNLSLAVFNLLPVPPLDGYHLLNDTLLKGRLSLDGRAFRIAQGAFMLLMFTGVFSELLYFLTSNLYEAVLRVFMMLTGQM